MSDQLVTVAEHPKKKKRKRNSRSPERPPQQQDPFASCAAELQVEFFKKVELHDHDNYVLLLDRHILFHEPE